MTLADNIELKKEALTVLEAEAQKRIEHIRHCVDFHLTFLRAQANMEINQLLLSVRQLTMEEFCHAYGADTRVYLDEQTRKRKHTDVRPYKKREREKHTTVKRASDPVTPKVASRPGSDTASLPKHPPAKESARKQPVAEENDVGPLFVHLTRENHPKVTFRIDAQRELSDLGGGFDLNAPDEILEQLGPNQRCRVHHQVENIIEQLSKLRERLA